MKCTSAVINQKEYLLEQVSSVRDKFDKRITVYRCIVPNSLSHAGFVGVAEYGFLTWAKPTWRVMGPLCVDAVSAGIRAENCLGGAIIDGVRNHNARRARQSTK